MIRRTGLLATALLLAASLGASAARGDVFAYPSEAYAIPYTGSQLDFWWHMKYNNAAGYQYMAVCFSFKTDAGTWQYPTDGTSYPTSNVPPPTATRPDRSCRPWTTTVDTNFAYHLSVASGHFYAFCAKEYDYLGGIGWQPNAIPAQCPGGFYSNQSNDGVTLTGIVATTQKPTSPITIDGGAQYTRDPTLHLLIGYSDALGVPAWPASFLCTNTSRDCVNGDGAAFSYVSNCSNYPASGDSCTYTYPGQDATIHECVRVADRAIPDAASAPPNLNAANAQYANLSDATCASIILDRQPPSLSATASTPSPVPGHSVTFTASASDSGSGLSGVYGWDFGDGTKQTGASVSHAYATAGTRTVTVTTSDKAGNSVSKQLTITVAQPSSGNNPGSGGGPSSGTAGSGGGGSVSSPVSTAQIGQQGGAGSGTQMLVIAASHGGDLRVLVPRRLSLHMAHQGLLLDLTAPAAGTVELILMKGHRTAARGRVRFGGSSSTGFTLILPRSLKPGRYRLIIKFSPRRGGGASRTISLTIVK